MKLSKVPPGCRYQALHYQIPGEHRWVCYKPVKASGLRTVTSDGAGRKKKNKNWPQSLDPPA